jgi:hypothetical protein
VVKYSVINSRRTYTRGIEFPLVRRARQRAVRRRPGVSALTDNGLAGQNCPTHLPWSEEVAMRLRSVFLLALAVLLFDATWTRFAADPPPPNMSVIGWIIPISGENTNCPVATHDLRECPSIPPSLYSGYYLVFEKGFDNGWRKDNIDNIWANVLGDLDLNTCAPYRLIHVRRLAKTRLIPPPCA